MRPVERGDRPVRYNWRGRMREEQEFTRYSQARRYLIDRLGAFCSYCEQLLPNPDVEHIDPKSIHDHLELDWENFLLACTNCNSTKGDTDINDGNRETYYWPHKHNTFMAFLYDDSGVVKPASNPAVDIRRAENTIKLVGLDKIAPSLGTIAYEEASDLRFENRLTAWSDATKWLIEYDLASEHVKAAFRNLLPTVLSKGYFSVWMTVFQAYPEVKEIICKTFKGTALTCFNKGFQPVNRNGAEV
ncbi:MAG: HNH endonuclease [Haliscomenobacteraceae bacterium CHB4]|nr:HNH endonuclease [Haliscomenobacteraceae bacterium CHB4]